MSESSQSVRPKRKQSSDSSLVGKRTKNVEADSPVIVDPEHEEKRLIGVWNEKRRSTWRSLVTEHADKQGSCWLHPAIIQTMPLVRSALIEKAVGCLEEFFHSLHVPICLDGTLGVAEDNENEEADSDAGEPANDAVHRDGDNGSSDNDGGDNDGGDNDGGDNDGGDNDGGDNDGGDNDGGDNDGDDVELNAVQAKDDVKDGIVEADTGSGARGRTTNILSPKIADTQGVKHASNTETDVSTPDNMNPIHHLLAIDHGFDWRFKMRAHPWAIYGSLYTSKYVLKALEYVRGVDNDQLPLPLVRRDDEWKREWLTVPQQIFCRALQETYAHLRMDYTGDVLIPMVRVRLCSMVPELMSVVVGYLDDRSLQTEQMALANTWFTDLNDGHLAPWETAQGRVWNRIMMLHKGLNVYENSDLLAAICNREAQLAELQCALFSLTAYLEKHVFSERTKVDEFGHLSLEKVYADRKAVAGAIRQWWPHRPVGHVVCTDFVHVPFDLEHVLHLFFRDWLPVLRPHFEMLPSQ